MNNNKIHTVGVIKKSLEGKELKRYDKLRDVEKDGYSFTNVWKCCNGKRNHHKNFKWQYQKQIN